MRDVLTITLQSPQREVSLRRRRRSSPVSPETVTVTEMGKLALPSLVTATNPSLPSTPLNVRKSRITPADNAIQMMDSYMKYNYTYEHENDEEVTITVNP